MVESNPGAEFKLPAEPTETRGGWRNSQDLIKQLIKDGRLKRGASRHGGWVGAPIPEGTFIERGAGIEETEISEIPEQE